MRLDGWTGLDVTRPKAGVLLITLDRPDRLNALTVAMKRDLIELLTEVQADDVLDRPDDAEEAVHLVAPSRRRERTGA